MYCAWVRNQESAEQFAALMFYVHVHVHVAIWYCAIDCAIDTPMFECMLVIILCNVEGIYHCDKHALTDLEILSLSITIARAVFPFYKSKPCICVFKVF